MKFGLLRGSWVTAGGAEAINRQYKYGFVTNIETDTVPRGLNEQIICLISAKKNEPNFMLDWRMKCSPTQHLEN